MRDACVRGRRYPSAYARRANRYIRPSARPEARDGNLDAGSAGWGFNLPRSGTISSSAPSAAGFASELIGDLDIAPAASANDRGHIDVAHRDIVDTVALLPIDGHEEGRSATLRRSVGLVEQDAAVAAMRGVLLDLAGRLARAVGDMRRSEARRVGRGGVSPVYIWGVVG